MYAIIEVGAKQVTIKKGDIVEVEKIEADKAQDIVLDKVLLACDGDKIEVGKPYIKGATVKAEVLCQTKADKVISYKYRRRKAYHRKTGHRQKLTMIKIKEIIAG